MIGTEAVSVTFGAITASRPTRTPSTTMQREPRNAPSSTITGRAPGGSGPPPIPTPAARGTAAPICAPEPTVAQVSTIVFGPTHAPMFTYDGIRMTPRQRNAPYRPDAGAPPR